MDMQFVHGRPNYTIHGHAECSYNIEHRTWTTMDM